MYGQNKRRVDGKTLHKMGSTLLSTEEDDGSYVHRPVRHINNMCLCYENKEDCTTCTDEQEQSYHSHIFILEDSDSDSNSAKSQRLRGGTNSLSSSDGSSLFDEDISRNFRETLDFNEKIDNWQLAEEDGSISEEETISSTLTSDLPDFTEKIDIISEKSIHFDTSELPMILRYLQRGVDDFSKFSEDTWPEFRKTLTLHGYQRAVLHDQLDDISHRLEVEKSIAPAEIEKIDNSVLDFEMARQWLEKCKEEYSLVRKDHLDRLFDSDLMSCNLVRIEEMKMKIDRFQKLIEPDLVDSEVDLDKILDDVSTCQSFRM